MGIFNRKKDSEEMRNFQVSSFDSLAFNCNSAYFDNKAMQLSAVYRCVDVISDAVAQLPCYPYLITKDGHKELFTTHNTYHLLSKEPNERMSRYTFFKCLVSSMLLEGNGYAYIQRDKLGNAVSLMFVESQLVTMIKNPDGRITYRIKGLDKELTPKDIIHVLNFSYDGLIGVSTLRHAKNVLGLAYDEESTARGFYKGGANLSGVLTVQKPMTAQQKKELKNAWQQSFSPSAGNPSGIAVLEGDMSYKSIGISAQDAEILSSRQFSVIEICRFFGVSPVKCFDLSKSSYSTVEASNLAFFTDTVQPLLEKIELELERKIYRDSEKDKIEVRFDTTALLRTDKSSLAAYYQTLFNTGVLSINDIRKELDLPAIKGGDNNYLQLNIAPISQINNSNKTEVEDGKED